MQTATESPIKIAAAEPSEHQAPQREQTVKVAAGQRKLSTLLLEQQLRILRKPPKFNAGKFEPTVRQNAKIEGTNNNSNNNNQKKPTEAARLRRRAARPDATLTDVRASGGYGDVIEGRPDIKSSSVVRLPQSRWPKTAQSTLSLAPGNSELSRLASTATGGNRNIHELTPNKTSSDTNRSHNSARVSRTTTTESPLVHTDHLAASSKLLYVAYPSPNQRQSVLSAKYQQEMNNRLEHMEAQQQQVVSAVPQLEIVNLEVSKSSATLTWNLSMLPANSLAVDQLPVASRSTGRTPSESTSQQDSWISSDSESVVRKEVPRQVVKVKRDTIRVTPTLGERGKLKRPAKRDEPEGQDDNNNNNGDEDDDMETRRLKHNDHEHLARRLEPLVESREEDEDSAEIEPETTTASTSSTTTTTKTTTTTTTTSRPLRRKPPKPKAEVAVSVMRHDGDTEAADPPSSASDAPPEVTGEPELARRLATVVSTSTTPRPTNSMTLNERVQLSRVHSMPSTGPSRRPPMRTASSSWPDPVRTSPAINVTVAPATTTTTTSQAPELRLQTARFRSERKQDANKSTTIPQVSPGTMPSPRMRQLAAHIPTGSGRVSSDEPPMFKLPSVPLNRIVPMITSSSSSVTASVVPTSERQKQRPANLDFNLAPALQSQRSGKSILVDFAVQNSTGTSTTAPVPNDPPATVFTTAAPPTITQAAELVPKTTSAEITKTTLASTTRQTDTPTVTSSLPVTTQPPTPPPTTTSTTTTEPATTTTTTLSPSTTSRPQITRDILPLVGGDAAAKSEPTEKMSLEQKQPSATISTSTTTTTTTTSPVPSSNRQLNMLPSQMVTKSSLQASSSTPNRPTRAETLPTRLAPASEHSEDSNRSKWLVRLRKFASNEVDIVKVVVNNLNVISQTQAHERRILFKDLDPSSAYEICVESASPNQQVADRHQILNANHFLKCHDTSDVSLAEDPNESSASLRRQDMSRPATESPVDFGEDLLATASTSAKSNQVQAKMKSLCREFFTPSADSTEVISFGASGQSEQQRNSTESAHIASSRRPKSLAGSNALKSHMELLEINDLSAPAGLNPSNDYSFVMASRSSQDQPNLRPSIFSPQPTTEIQNFSSTSVNTRQVLSQPNQHDYLNASLLPIVGCVFALIFMVTLINILLNSISCFSASSSSKRRQQRRQALRHHQHLASHSGVLSASAATGNKSVYADSDHSGATTISQSRFVVVGKEGEPFGSASAYFDVPASRLKGAGAPDQLSLGASGGSSTESSGGKHSSSYLLSSAARFPLGPSFEGDEKHNADMVGLARRNYDNFINHIYNSEQAEPTGDQNDSLNDTQAPKVFHSKTLAPNSRRHTQHNHNHHNHHHHHHHRLSHQQLQSNNGSALRMSPTISESRGQLVGSRGCQSGGDISPTPSSSRLSGGGANRRQRIRFDKINPIYNMDGLYGSSARATRLSSFGHANPNLVVDVDEHPQVQFAGTRAMHSNGSSSNVIMENDGDECPLCSPSNSSFACPESPTCCGASQQQQPQQHQKLQRQEEIELVEGGSGEISDERPADDGNGGTSGAPYFNCCLDRQKQRIQEQQQQLELVMSKNGSLIPQPFINPVGPSGEASENLASHTVDSNDNSLADNLLEGYEAATTKAAANEKGYFMFGDEAPTSKNSPAEASEPKEQRAGEASGTSPKPASPADSPPPPPPPLPMPPTTTAAKSANVAANPTSGGPTGASSPLTATASVAAAAPLVQVNPMATGTTRHRGAGSKSSSSDSSGVGLDESNETINRSDFDQRRNQLASKLHLAARGKLGQN